MQVFGNTLLRASTGQSFGVTSIPYRNYAIGQHMFNVSLKAILRDVDGVAVDINGLFRNKKVVLLGVTGAYTPMSNNKHVSLMINV